MVGKTQFTREVAESYDRYKTHFYDYGSDARTASDIIRCYKPDAREILEVGIGTAGLAIEMARNGFRVDGIDNSPFMLEIARKKMKSSKDTRKMIRLISQRCESMGLERGGFKSQYPVVISHGLFYFIGQTNGFAFASYISGMDNNRAAFERIYQHTSPEGLLLINMIKDYRLERRGRDPVDLGKDGIWSIEYRLTPYDSNGEATLTNVYTCKKDRRTTRHTFVKSVFRKEDMLEHLERTGFEFLEETLDTGNSRGFYVAKKVIR